MKDVIASYESLVYLFERIHFFLQRLNLYTAIPLTPEMTLLLGKIMAQVLSVLAVSTKEMKENRISGSILSTFCLVADYDTEKFMKRIAGRTDVDDALQRLDMLTKEENLITAARNLQITHRVDANVKETKELTRDVHDNVVTIDNNLKVTRHGAQNSFQSFIHFTHPWLSVLETAIDEQQRSLHPDGFIAVIDCSLSHDHREPVSRETPRMALSSESLHQS